METEKVTNFHDGKECKRPRPVDSSYSLFCLHAPEEVILSGKEFKIVDLQTKVILPSDMTARIFFFFFWPLFEKNRLYIQSNDIVDSGGWLKIKLLSQKFLRKITIGKGDTLVYL